MKLYHAHVSTCSQKVRLVLAEKGLGYDSEFLDLQKGDQFDADYLKMNPAGVVPTLEDQGAVFVESTLINEYLDDAYPEVPLKPEAAGARHAMRLWCKRIDDLHPFCGIQTYAIGVRPGMLKRPREDVDALIEAIPDPVKRAVRRSVIDHGVKAPEFAGAYAAHERLFALAENALGERPFLAGETFSLADAAFLPYVLRVDHLVMDSLLADRPALGAWYARVKDRPSYATAVSNFLPEPVVKGFRASGEAVADEVVKVASAL